MVHQTSSTWNAIQFWRHQFGFRFISFDSFSFSIRSIRFFSFFLSFLILFYFIYIMQNNVENFQRFFRTSSREFFWLVRATCRSDWTKMHGREKYIENLFSSFQFFFLLLFRRLDFIGSTALPICSSVSQHIFLHRFLFGDVKFVLFCFLSRHIHFWIVSVAHCHATTHFRILLFFRFLFLPFFFLISFFFDFPINLYSLVWRCWWHRRRWQCHFE